MVSTMLLTQPPEYARFFYAFGFEEEEIVKVLSLKIRDVYSGIFWREELIAIFMLKGWDEGYDIPSFGLFIAHKHRSVTLLHVAIDVAKLITRFSGGRRLMATIHPDNISIRGAAKLGFVDSGKRTEAGNVVYFMEL